MYELSGENRERGWVYSRDLRQMWYLDLLVLHERYEIKTQQVVHDLSRNELLYEKDIAAYNLVHSIPTSSDCFLSNRFLHFLRHLYRTILVLSWQLHVW